MVILCCSQLQAMENWDLPSLLPNHLTDAINQDLNPNLVAQTEEPFDTSVTLQDTLIEKKFFISCIFSEKCEYALQSNYRHNIPRLFKNHLAKYHPRYKIRTQKIQRYINKFLISTSDTLI
jgi:hypothetical protein